MKFQNDFYFYLTSGFMVSFLTNYLNHHIWEICVVLGSSKIALFFEPFSMLCNLALLT